MSSEKQDTKKWQDPDCETQLQNIIPLLRVAYSRSRDKYYVDLYLDNRYSVPPERLYEESPEFKVLERIAWECATRISKERVEELKRGEHLY